MSDLEDRFWDKVDRGEDDECWEWQASTSDGYGQFSVHYEVKSAHRVAYRFVVGDPGDSFVLHECDNPACVNPAHLYLGTHQDNMDDMVERGRATGNKPRGEKHGHTKLTERDVGEIKWKLENTSMTKTAISDEYPVSQRTISNIEWGVTWEDVDSCPPR